MAAVDCITSPYPARNPENRFFEFYNNIHEMVLQQGLSNDEVVAALRRRGFETFKASLKQAFKPKISTASKALMEYEQTSQTTLQRQFNQIFHHT
jgi:hypothetical protein